MSSDEHRRIASGKVFQARGPATAKARSPSVEHRVAGTVKSAEEAERRRRRGSMLSTRQMTSCRYLGSSSRIPLTIDCEKTVHYTNLTKERFLLHVFRCTCF